MNVSAVGFLFQNKVKAGKNYTCIIHKVNSNGNYNRNIISSPLLKQTTIEVVSPDDAYESVAKTVDYLAEKHKDSKFIGATIKDGIKETEIHSVFFDKLFAVRTKDEKGKNHFHVLTGDKTRKVLANNLYLNA